MKYGIDENGKEILIDSTGYQVMMEWEKPYMEALIDHLNPSGNVLEIGFGLGYSANQIQKHNIDTHTIIEDNPIVLEKLYLWAQNQKHKVIIVEGTWQDQLKNLGKFDSIFFDDAPNSKHEDKDTLRGTYFYNQVLKSHVNPGCKMSFYSVAPTYWISNSFVDWSCAEYKIDIPENARYVKEYSKNNKTVYLPLVIFTKGVVENIIPYAIDKNHKFGILSVLQ